MTADTQFNAAWWLPGPHLPTLWSSVIRRTPKVSFIPERIVLPDGDFLDLFWTGEDRGPLVIALHGLEGSAESKNVRGILSEVERRGWGGVLMQFRGCGARLNNLDRSYHSGDTEDLRFIIQNLLERYPERPLFCVGISLGGNVLLKYLGENPLNSGLECACAVSVPFELGAGAKRLNRGFSRIYQRHLVNSLRRKVRRKFARREAPIDLSGLDEWSSFYAFDHHVTAPLHGFDSAEDYYARSSSRQFLRNIRTPTLIIHSSDDPFLTQNAIPEPNELAPSVELELTNKGGHVGFVGGKIPLVAKYWLDERVVGWFSQYKSSTNLV